MATVTKVAITLRVMIVVQNHAERDDYYHQSSITLRVMITAWNHAERDDYCLPSHSV